MAANRVYERIVRANLSQQLGRFFAVLFRPLLKIHVVQQADQRQKSASSPCPSSFAYQRMTPSTVKACCKWNGSLLYFFKSASASSRVMEKTPFQKIWKLALL